MSKTCSKVLKQRVKEANVDYIKPYRCLQCLIFCISLFYRTTTLSSKLMEFDLGTDKQTFLSKLIKSIFISYLENYIDVETAYLRSRSSMILQRYYDSKNHQKRPIGSGG